MSTWAEPPVIADACVADCAVTFPAGLVGLPRMKRFMLVGEGRGPWLRLESLDEPQSAFTVVDPRAVGLSYDPPVEPPVLEATQAVSAREVTLLVLAVEGSAGPESLNLLAPLAVNVGAGLGTQLVLDPARYPLRYSPGG